MKEARVDRGLYKCAGCCNVFKNKEVRVDHVDPVVPILQQGDKPGEDQTLRSYVLRMFPESSGFQILCTQCHNTKTQGENSARREAKSNNKGNLV